ncbi:MAG: DUF1801 domain-containing protein [Chitinophagaceae bacterium]|nr:DUF1801 domain-containing protein [Chitinophagaceae bacterium]
MSINFSTTSEYIESLPPDTKVVFRGIRALIKKLIPQGTERISYGIPAVFVENKPAVYFAGYKSHVSIYPAPRSHPDFKDELKSYKGGKGTVQFPLTDKIPSKLITRIVKFRLAEIKEKQAVKKSKSKTK